MTVPDPATPGRDVARRFRRLWVPGIPIIFSLALSASTVGTHVDWQDSGFFLAAVKEVAVLYPPGFVLYLTLCKVWTLALFFVDFVLAVHLFSACSIALASGILALAARDLLRTRGRLFQVVSSDPGPIADAIGVAIGCLAASGYTVWYAGLLAKDYALYYLILSLLFWRMIRADDSLLPRDFTIVAALIGLSWQAHPSATLGGLAMVLFVAAHGKTVGGKGLARGVAVAAACALGPALLLPFLASRETITEFNGPSSLGDLLRYLRGSQFTEMPGAFGWDASRLVSIRQYFWEEFLGVGLLLVTVGLARIAMSNRRLLFGVLAWVVPVAVLTLLFKIEGQHDLWMVSAWLPLWLVGAVGAYAVVSAVPRHARVVVGGLALAGVSMAAATNLPLVTRRGYTLAETFGGILLDKVDQDSILVLISDDATAICRALQVTRGTRRDVLIIREEDLGLDERGEPGRPYRRLQKRWDALRPLDQSTARAGLERGVPGRDVLLAAFLNANGPAGRTIYLERTPQAVDLLRKDFVLTPAGALMKWEPRPGSPLDPRFWAFPVRAEEVRAALRRARGQDVELTGGAISVRPQTYEERLLITLLRARQNLAFTLLRSSDPANWRKCADLYESILRLRPGAETDGRILFPLGIVYSRLGEADRAQPLLERAVEGNIPAHARAEAAVELARLCLRKGLTAEARRYLALARSQPEMSPEVRQELETLAPR